jgi:hypothetical protein
MLEARVFVPKEKPVTFWQSVLNHNNAALTSEKSVQKIDRCS